MPVLRFQVCAFGRYSPLPCMHCTSPQLKREVSIITSPVSDPCDFAPIFKYGERANCCSDQDPKSNQIHKAISEEVYRL